VIPHAPLSDDDRAGLQRLRAEAEAHPFDNDAVLGVCGRLACVDAVRLGHPLVTLRPGLLAATQAGFTLGFTIEEYQAGWARHLSFAVPVPGRIPPARGIIAIAGELGMRLDVFDPDCWSHWNCDRPEDSTTLDVLELMRPGETPP
jgi:hypothetical protein